MNNTATLFPNENPKVLPFMFAFGERRDNIGDREPGRETDVLTDDHNSDTD